MEEEARVRTIVAGSRGITSLSMVKKAMSQCGWTPTVIISGTARGVDRLGEEWAKAHNVPVECYPADWERYGPSAGYRRNRIMVENAEALVAVWDGKSRGTEHTISLAREKGLRVFVYIPETKLGWLIKV